MSISKALLIISIIFNYKICQGSPFKGSETEFEIILNKCAICHKNGESVPFVLEEVKDVIKHQGAIKFVLENNIMPPWQTDVHYRSFRNQLLLTPIEREKLVKWLSGDIGVKGVKSKKASPIETNDMGDPDLVLNMERPYKKKASPNDELSWFQIPYQFEKDVYLKAIRLGSSNESSLHHCELFSNKRDKMPDSNLYQESAVPFINTDILYSENGVSLFNDKRFVAGRFSNSPIQKYPIGVSNKIPTDRYLMYYVHYAPTPIDEVDSSWIELYFSKNKNDREFIEYGVHAFHNLLNPPFFIDSNEVKTFYCKKQIDTAISLFSVLPHAHHLCKNMLAFAVTPRNDTIPLIKILKWDFNWQWVYEFENFVVLPKNSIVHFIATFDNTIKNKDNPFSPPRPVKLSMNAFDEMMDLFLQCVVYQKGDERRKIEYE